MLTQHPFSVSSLIIVGWLSMFSSTVAATTADAQEFKTNRFFFGLGAKIVRFNTNVKFTEKDTGNSTFIDMEGTLNLPQNKSVPLLYGYYRFGQKHGIGWQYFRVKREGLLFDERINLGDLTINGRATLTDKSDFSFISYNYTLFEDDRAFIHASFGLYMLDLEYEFRAEGTLSSQDMPLVTEVFTLEESVFAPLPMFGIDAMFMLTPKWSFGAKVSLVGGSYQEVSAGVVDSRIRARYKFNRRISGLVGVSYFDADVTVDDSDLKTKVAYGFDGAYLGLDLGF